MNTKICEGYAAEIVNALAAIKPETVPNSRNATWTRKIKEDIGGIGKSHKFRVCASGFRGEFEGEWLYDMIWYRNNENERLESVPLVLESEWDLDYFGIRFDFEKLLLANSPLKVMVFQNYGDTVEAIFEKLKCGIDEYIFEVPSIYILACYRWDKREFEIKKIRKEPYKVAELMP